MSAVTSLLLPLSAEWIPTLLQMSKRVRDKVDEEGKQAEWGGIKGYARMKGDGGSKRE